MVELRADGAVDRPRLKPGIAIAETDGVHGVESYLMIPLPDDSTYDLRAAEARVLGWMRQCW